MTHPLAAFREKSGLTQDALAKRLGVSRWYVNRLEKRERSPSFKVVERIMELTDGEVTANDFLRQSEGAQ